MASAGQLARVVALALLAAATFVDAAPTWTDAVGYERLVRELGDELPTGRGVSVAQVETAAADDPRFGPDPDHRSLSDVRFNGPVSSVVWGSRHATTVAGLFYGRGRSMAPGIREVDVFEVRDFLRMVVGWAGLPPAARSSARVWNHSWVGGKSPHMRVVLGRLDAAALAEEWLVICGVRNKGANDPLLASAYNVIAVGMSNGRHAKGAARVDSVYNSARTRPHLVAPMKTSSASVPLVSAAAALLVEAGADPALSRDPVDLFTTVGSGRKVHNAQRAGVVTAALLAGANRRAVPLPTPVEPEPPAYRERPAHRTDNGLDRRFGAGQLDAYEAWRIVAAGEFNSREDESEGGDLPAAGFDFDPAFGGLADSNAQASYDIEAAADGHLAVALIWPARVDRGHPPGTTTTRVYDLTLTLLDVTDGNRRVARSASDTENGEHVYAPVRAGKRYRLLVTRGLDQEPFAWQYALAWRTTPD